MTRSAPRTPALEHSADRAPRYSVQRFVRHRGHHFLTLSNRSSSPLPSGPVSIQYAPSPSTNRIRMSLSLSSGASERMTTKFEPLSNTQYGNEPTSPR